MKLWNLSDFWEDIEIRATSSQNFGGINISDDLSDSYDEEDIFFKEPEQLMDAFHPLKNLTYP